jgi:hypothetical protein
MAASPSTPRKHFSMIRAFHLADVFTLANAACGVAAIGMAMRALMTHRVEDLLVAAAFAPAAFVFDVLDGRIARWRQTSSALGRELDSLATSSFRSLPRSPSPAASPAAGTLILVYFVCCGVSRPGANVTAESLSEGAAKVKYFGERRSRPASCSPPSSRGRRGSGGSVPIFPAARGPSSAPTCTRCAAVRALRDAHGQQDLAHRSSDRLAGESPCSFATAGT